MKVSTLVVLVVGASLLIATAAGRVVKLAGKE